MAKIKVRNIGSSTVIVPNGRGGDIIIPPGHVKEIEDKYLPVFSGKLIEEKEPELEETADKEVKPETTEANPNRQTRRR